MKKRMILSLIVLFNLTINAQEILKEKCKTKDVSVQAYENDKLAENSIIVKINTIRLDKVAQTMDDLSEDNLKEIKKWARQFKSCTVYLDFNEVYKERDINPLMKDEDLVYLIVREQEK